MEAIERTITRLQTLADSFSHRIQVLQAQNNLQNTNSISIGYVPPGRRDPLPNPNGGTSNIFISGGIVPAPVPPVNHTGWQIWSCCTLWFGLNFLLGGIALLITGSIFMASKINSNQTYPIYSTNYSYQTCNTSYVKYGNQCCYRLGSTTYYNYCYTPNYTATTTSTSYQSSQDLILEIVFLCVGGVMFFVGIPLLCKSKKIYQNNNNRGCCFF